MRPRVLRSRIRWWAAPLLIFIGIVTGGLLSARANAEPAIDATAVCNVLAKSPTVDGVTAIIASVVKDAGISPETAFQGVTIAVALKCPTLFPVLRKFTELYQPAPEFRQGYVA